MDKLISGSFWKLKEGKSICKLISQVWCTNQGGRSVVLGVNYKNLIVKNEDCFLYEYEPLQKINIREGDLFKDTSNGDILSILSTAIHEDTKEELVIYSKMNNKDKTRWITSTNKLNEILEDRMIPRFTKEGNMRDL